MPRLVCTSCLSAIPMPSANVEGQEGCFSGRNGELEVSSGVSYRESSYVSDAFEAPPRSDEAPFAGPQSPLEYGLVLWAGRGTLRQTRIWK